MLEGVVMISLSAVITLYAVIGLFILMDHEA